MAFLFSSSWVTIFLFLHLLIGFRVADTTSVSPSPLKRDENGTCSALVDAAEGKTSVAQAGDDLGQGNHVLGCSADVEYVYTAWRGQLQAARDDVGRWRTSPPERVDRPANFMRIAIGREVNGYLSVVVTIRQAVKGFRRTAD